MNIKKPKSLVTTLSVVGVLALGVVLSGCGTPAEGGGNTGNQDAAREQFLAERSGTPDPNATPLPGAGGGNRMMSGMMPGAFGTVDKVDGNKITITNPLDNTQMVVEVSSDATITRQVEAERNDIKPGAAVTAIGTLEGDTFTALTVQVGMLGLGSPQTSGDFLGGPGGPGALNASGTPMPPPDTVLLDGTPPPTFSGAGPDGMQRFVNEMLSGTVEKVAGDMVTLKSVDGQSVQFKLTDSTVFQKEENITVSDIAPGETINASGTAGADGEPFKATSIQVLGAMTMQRTIR